MSPSVTGAGMELCSGFSWADEEEGRRTGEHTHSPGTYMPAHVTQQWQQAPAEDTPGSDVPGLKHGCACQVRALECIFESPVASSP